MIRQKHWGNVESESFLMSQIPDLKNSLFDLGDLMGVREADCVAS